jgi:5-methylcytosine-specific restriction endonuclease McrA
MFSIIAEKRCTKCGKTKQLDDFPKQARHKDGRHSWCKKCHSKASAAWNKSNPEKFRAHQRKWFRKWCVENPEKARENGRNNSRKWAAKNPDKIREKNRNWARANPEKVRKWFYRWLDSNRDKFMQNVRNRYARKKNAGGKITVKEWRALKEKYNYTCLCCRRREPEIKLTLDHVLPLVKGGRNIIDNAQPLCGSCNSSKGTKVVDYRQLV